LNGKLREVDMGEWEKEGIMTYAFSFMMVASTELGKLR
jgi:hypothetical protein